jgi:hypothetical protein
MCLNQPFWLHEPPVASRFRASPIQVRRAQMTNTRNRAFKLAQCGTNDSAIMDYDTGNRGQGRLSGHQHLYWNTHRRHHRCRRDKGQLAWQTAPSRSS